MASIQLFLDVSHRLNGFLDNLGKFLVYKPFFEERFGGCDERGIRRRSTSKVIHRAHF